MRVWPIARAFGKASILLLVVLLCGAPPTCLGALRAIGDFTDTISSDDLGTGAVCANGCVREVMSGVAVSIGEVDCDLQVQNLLDHTEGDVLGGALNVVHSCTNADGDLLYEVRTSTRIIYEVLYHVVRICLHRFCHKNAAWWCGVPSCIIRRPKRTIDMLFAFDDVFKLSWLCLF